MAAFVGVAMLALAIFAFVCLFAIVRLLGFIRKKLPAKVNCWFCNFNAWIPYHCKNSWHCKRCDQYNGFLSNGDYNVILDTRTVNHVNYNKNLKPLTFASNGLCRKCNINQNLKIRQLASFIPMNEKKFNAEIEDFKSHLEKVYSLCSVCKKYIKQKLLSERGMLLGNKFVDSRIKQESNKKLHVVNFVKDMLKDFTKLVTIIFLVFTLYNVINNLDLFLSKKIVHFTRKYFKDSFSDIEHFCSPYVDIIINNITNIVQKISCPPVLSVHYSSLYNVIESYSNHSSVLEINNAILNLNVVNMVELIAILGLILQLLMHTFDFNINYIHIMNDVIWALAIYTSKIGIKYLYILQVVFGVILVLNTLNRNKNKYPKATRNKIKNLSFNKNSKANDDNLFDNTSDSDSCDSINLAEENYFNAVETKSSRGSILSYNCKNTSSPFNYMQCKSENTHNNSFYNYSDFSACELDLDKSISSLSIGRKKDFNSRNDQFFTTRQYNCTSPNLFASSPTGFPKPVLSPSRLSHGTQQSWVAGGYWGADSPQSNLHETGSSSSQSSGFESLASSMRRRNLNLYHPSREESVSSEYEKNLDGLYKSSYSNQSCITGCSNFVSDKSLVFPNLKQNSTIFIPQVPFDSTYRNSAFVRPNTNKSFVPLNTKLNDSTSYRSPT